MLAVSRLTSHSHGRRQGLVEIVDVEEDVALRRGEAAEVHQVSVAAGLHAKSGCGVDARSAAMTAAEPR